MKKKAVVVYQFRSTFVARDIEILSEKYSVKEFTFNNSSSFNYILSFIHQFLFHLFLGFRYKRVLVEGAGYFSLIPVFISKIWPSKSVIIVFGTDGAKLTEINYGNYRKPILAWFTTMSYRFTDKILTVHNSLERSVYTYEKIKFPKQGLKNLSKNITTPVREVVYGYDYSIWHNTVPFDERQRDFLSVAYSLDHANYLRKGYDIILDLAEKMPEKTFTLVGDFPKVRSIPSNVILISRLNQQELLKIYNQHKFYFQVSLFEGFPNALCEAMLCGCIPIGSDVAGIPDIIGTEGYILKMKNLDLFMSLIENALINSQNLNPRKQIIDNFPIERRRREILESFEF